MVQLDFKPFNILDVSPFWESMVFDSKSVLK